MNIIAADHRGNLTAEQEALLCRFWQTLFVLYGMCEDVEPITSVLAPSRLNLPRTQ